MYHASNQFMKLTLHTNQTLIQGFTNSSHKRMTSFLDQPQEEIVIGFLLPYTLSNTLKQSYFTAGEYFASAFILAIEDINENRKLLPGHKVTYVWNNTECLENNTLSLQYEQLTRDRPVDVIIGPGCHCSGAAKLGAALNVAAISYVSIVMLLLTFFHK